MYDVKQFQPTLYLVVILGLIGFSMATESPGMLFFSVLGAILNAWLVMSGRFRPMPRWLANVVTLAAAAAAVMQISENQALALTYIGQFLVILHLVKLYEQRANRDQAQLLILSLLLMVAGSISTTSLWFGMLMIAYLFIALYCCLLFHLKTEADQAKAAFPIPDEKINPAILKQDQHFLPRSMRRLTALVSSFGISFAVAVFVLFPRGAGQGLLGQMHVRPPASLTGFSDQVGFDQIARIQQNFETVARVQVWRNGEVFAGTDSIYLRGATLDTYTYNPGSIPVSRWTRYPSRKEELEPLAMGTADPSLLTGGDVWKQRITLEPNRSKFLFAMPGLHLREDPFEPRVAIKTSRALSLRYAPADQSLQVMDPINTMFEYEIFSSNSAARPPVMDLMALENTFARPSSSPAVLQQVRPFAVAAGGQPAGDRPALRVMHPNDAQIARNIERYLQANFTYTLDLTADRDRFAGRDPVVVFLSDVRRGHCEYFASSMALMCQSLGMQARVVTGFRCDEYSDIGAHYVVRQAHAHMWVEVLLGDQGWVTFDPTSGREGPGTRTAGLFEKFKQFFDYLEYKWAINVVAYDARGREKFMESADQVRRSLSESGSGMLQAIRDWLEGNFSILWSTGLYTFISILVALTFLALVTAIVTYVVQQARLRRRAARIGLDALPVDEQVRLARQLAFYDQLTQMLAHHRIHRPPNLTPMEFARSLTFLPAEIYDVIRRMTEMFYRVRFGRIELSPRRRSHLQSAVARLQGLMP